MDSYSERFEHRAISKRQGIGQRKQATARKGCALTQRAICSTVPGKDHTFAEIWMSVFAEFTMSAWNRRVNRYSLTFLCFACEFMS